MRYSDFYAKGLPPVVGGVLDQCHWFTDACRWAWREESENKRELGVPF